MLAGFDHSTPEPAFSPQADVVASLGMSKQAASQLIDTLVLREYLERRIDPEDRRRMGVRLTAQASSPHRHPNSDRFDRGDACGPDQHRRTACLQAWRLPG